MNPNILIELGKLYEVIYTDDSRARFRFIGGPDAKAFVAQGAEEKCLPISKILNNVKSVEEIKE